MKIWAIIYMTSHLLLKLKYEKEKTKAIPQFGFEYKNGFRFRNRKYEVNKDANSKVIIRIGSRVAQDS